MMSPTMSAARRLAVAACLVALGLTLTSAFAQQRNSDRPTLPYGVLRLEPAMIGAYDSKAEPVARVTTAQDMMYRKGWEAIEKYFPTLGIPAEREIPINPADAGDHRFAAQLVTEDPGRSPTPLVMMICSLDPSAVTGKLKNLRDELVEATQLPDYSTWSLNELRHAGDELTQERMNLYGVKYRAPRSGLSYKQSVQLYAMTVELVRKETKWKEWEKTMNQQGYSNLDLPDMEDFANRLMHQLPHRIENSQTAALLLYRPAYLSQPVSKGEFEERADVVLITRKANTFRLEQFPIYLTADQAEWNPSWIFPKDDIKDTTLIARKFEYDWTRFDGPYLRYRRDQLNARVVYRCTVRFAGEGITIEGERFVAPRGEVVKIARERSYDPRKMRAFQPGVDGLLDTLAADWLDLDPYASMLRLRPSHVEQALYFVGQRQFLVYQTGANAFASSLYPPQTASVNEASSSGKASK